MGLPALLRMLGWAGVRCARSPLFLPPPRSREGVGGPGMGCSWGHGCFAPVNCLGEDLRCLPTSKGNPRYSHARSQRGTSLPQGSRSTGTSTNITRIFCKRSGGANLPSGSCLLRALQPWGVCRVGWNGRPGCSDDIPAKKLICIPRQSLSTGPRGRLLALEGIISSLCPCVLLSVCVPLLAVRSGWGQAMTFCCVCGITGL